MNASEMGPERIPSKEEVLSQIRSRCESFEIESELSDANGVYYLEAKASDNSKRYIYQREGTFQGNSKPNSALKTTLILEDLDDSYSRCIADYDSETGEWIEQ